MKGAWAIVRGDYSTFSVYLICDTEERAKRLCDRLNTEWSDSWGRYKVQEYPYLDDDETEAQIKNDRGLLVMPVGDS